MVEGLVGSPFLEKFAPKNGPSNLLMLIIPIFALIAIELVSIQYQVNSLFKVYDCYSLVVREFCSAGKISDAQTIHQSQLKVVESIPNVKGFISCLGKGYEVLSLFLYILYYPK